MFDKIKSFFKTEQKSKGGLVEIPVQSGTLMDLIIGYGSGTYQYDYLSSTQTSRFYRQSGSLSTSVDIIAQEVEQIKPVIKQSDGLLTDEHEVLDLLSNPNSFNESYSTLIGQITRFWLLNHNAFIYASGIVTRPPIELFSARNEAVTTQKNTSDGFAQTYSVNAGIEQGRYKRERLPSGDYRYYDSVLKELWKMYGFSSTSDRCHGDSPILAISLDVWNQIKGRIHNVKLLDNGGRPSLVVSFLGEDFDQDMHDERKQALQEQLAGPENAGKIVPMSAQDMKITELGKSNKDMDYLNLEKLAAQATYNRYRIPLPLVTSDASTFNNMGTAVSQLYDFAVLPTVNKIFSELSLMLLPRFGLDPRKELITYNPEEITALKSRRLDELKARKEIGVETTNEIREGLPNREPIQGGDTLYQAANLVPIGVDLFTDDNATTVEEDES